MSGAPQANKSSPFRDFLSLSRESRNGEDLSNATSAGPSVPSVPFLCALCVKKTFAARIIPASP